MTSPELIATLPDGRRVTRKEAEAWELAQFMADTREHQAEVGPFFCYLSTDGRALTTWTGAKLADVVDLTHTAAGFGGWQRDGGRWYFRAVDSAGRRWFGNSPGKGMFARARLAKCS